MKHTHPRPILFAGLLAGAFLTVVGTVRADDRDDQIEKAFKASHVYQTELKQTGISIDAENGVVDLKGSVDNEDQKRLAEDTARGIPGVVRVEDHVKVENAQKEGSDEWIALKVRGALLFHRNVSATDTHVQVQNGVVTLTGTANSDAEKALAAEYANDIKGVVRVDNQIRVVAPADRDRVTTANNPDVTRRSDVDTERRTVGNRIDDASITAQLKSALAVRKSTSALRTDVTTRDGVVTITGEARNGAEKDLVTKLAENIDGVRSVKNDMTVRDR